MYFVLSKTLGVLMQPSVVLFLAMTAGLLLVLTRYRRAGIALFSVTLFTLWAVTVVPVGEAMVRHLEERFPRPQAVPERIGGIIALGGAINPMLTRARKQLAVEGSVERLLFFGMLADTHPDVPLVYTGGSGSLLDQSAKEADHLGALARLVGLDMDRVILETASRNTMENAAFSKKLVDIEPDRPWVLITSARHMPRAVGIFRKQGWPIIPYPVDYVTLPDRGWVPVFENLGGQALLDGAFHEFMGMAAAYVLGRSDSLYPAPRP